MKVSNLLSIDFLIGSLLIAVFGWMVQSASEEIAVRGWLIPTLGIRYNPLFAVLLTGGVFMDKKLILYIAMSLDGYIAEKDGGIGFLDETPTTLPDLGYEEFYSSISAIIIGGKTYRQVKNELSPEKWPYDGMPCYVYTRQKQENAPNIYFTDLPPVQLLKVIQKEKPGNIWLMGGGEIICNFMQENLIDEYYIYVMPTILGSGISLFPPDFPKANLKLESCKNIGEIAELIYRKVGTNK